jgi:hypothetical protein
LRWLIAWQVAQSVDSWGFACALMRQFQTIRREYIGWQIESLIYAKRVVAMRRESEPSDPVLQKGGAASLCSLLVRRVHTG